MSDTDNNRSITSTPEDVILATAGKLGPLLEEANDPCQILNPSSKICPSSGEQPVNRAASTSGHHSLLSGVMETARSRFDSFWGTQKNDSV